MRRLAVALLGLAVATLAAVTHGGGPGAQAPAVAAGPPGAQPAGPPLSASPKMHAQWVREIRAASDAVAAAQRRAEAARLAYAGMMRHRKARGDRKAAIVKERDESLAALEGARRQLDELLERAHRSRVPPGWVREGLGEVQVGPDDTPAAPEK